MPRQDLEDEKATLEEHRDQCDALLVFLDEGDAQIDLSSDMTVVSLSLLTVVYDSIARRIKYIDDLLEASDNHTMDRFRRAV